MKKCFLTLLIAALMLSSTALADSCAAMLDGRLFLSVESYAQENSLIQRDHRTARHLQSADGCLYYVAVEELGEDHYSETLMRLDNAGVTAIGESRASGFLASLNADYTHYQECTRYHGYTDMTVYDGQIYFISSDYESGSYETQMDSWNEELDGSYSCDYASSASVYRMDLDGGNLTRLIPGLGNGGSHMAIANGVIAVSSCWVNPFYAYDFSNFMLYDLDGKLLRTLENHSADGRRQIYKEDCAFTVIVNGIQTDGERIYASLGDSEGDFASSRLVDMDEPDEVILYEAFYVPAILTDEGFIAFMSEAESELYVEGMENSLSVRLVNLEGQELLARVPADFLYATKYLSVAEDHAYLIAGEQVVRIPLKGGEVCALGADGFAPAPEFAPED